MDNREEKKRSILYRTLIHVPFDGWSQGLLEQAAQEVGLDSSYGWRLFPQGAPDAISYWSSLLDQEMLENLSSQEGMRVRERVALAIKTRLNLLIPYREAARQTAKSLSLPPHLGRASCLVYQTVNEIWYYAGDTSTDYNFYTKRALLSWVYSATFLYWLKDQSEGFEKTWLFLDQRIEEVLKLPHLPQKIFQTLFSWRPYG